jgi:hypothetical protein
VLRINVCPFGPPWPAVGAIVVSSAFTFTLKGAKTSDHRRIATHPAAVQATISY